MAADAIRAGEAEAEESSRRQRGAMARRGKFKRKTSRKASRRSYKES
jgi:hypothetical protein